MEKSNLKTNANNQDMTDVLSKSNVRDRLNKTKLSENKEGYEVAKWEPDDEKLVIKWKTYATELGEVVIASTTKGICFLGFGDEKRSMSLGELHEKFPGNKLEEGSDHFQEEAIKRIKYPASTNLVHLHLKGTLFQMNVWEKILQVPFGGLTTYGMLGEDPKNARAVGTAVGANPVCLIVGCHRVVHSDGNIEGFHYGNAIKERLLAFEASHSKVA